MVKRLASGLVLWLLCGATYAACTGSGLTRYCTSGSTAAQITSAISAAGSGGVVTLQAGTYAVTGEISLNGVNGTTVICETPAAPPDGCNVSRNGNIFTIDSVPSDRTGLFRISGMNITGSEAGTAKIWFYGANDLLQVRIDNNYFSISQTGIAIITGSTGGSYGCVFGVIDGNTFTGTDNFMAWKSLGCGAYEWESGLQGTARNMFFENNTCSFTNNADNGNGCTDAWLPAGVVIRYNTIYNSRIVSHSYCHGGPANNEVYGNTVQDPYQSNYRNLHFQGSGEIIAFDNVLYGGYVTLQHFRSDNSSPDFTATTEGGCTSVCDGTQPEDGNRSGGVGYPCYQQPGRDTNAQLRPIYLWKNRTNSNVRADISMESGTAAWTGLDANCANTDAGRINCHLQLDRDIFQAGSVNEQTSATSPFNGTSGVGFGILAYRPTTCSAGTNVDTEDAGKSGVAYWATDVKTLYRCATTNTWVVHYRPYVYPHPLVSGKPAPPLNPRTQ